MHTAMNVMAMHDTMDVNGLCGYPFRNISTFNVQKLLDTPTKRIDTVVQDSPIKSRLSTMCLFQKLSEPLSPCVTPTKSLIGRDDSFINESESLFNGGLMDYDDFFWPKRLSTATILERLDSLRKNDDRVEDDESNHTMIKEEMYKKEKDWKERRKYFNVDNEICEIENNIYAKHEDMEDRIESFYTCWNRTWSKEFFNSKLFRDKINNGEKCCPEYDLHKVFRSKECTNKMLPMAEIPCMYDNPCSKHQVRKTKPTLVRQQHSECLRDPKDVPKRSILKPRVNSANTIRSAAHTLTTSVEMITPASVMNSCQKSTRIVKTLESDGDSPRSLSPQTDITTDEDESIFHNDEVTEIKLSDYISEGAASAGRNTPMNGTGQLRRKNIQQKSQRERLTENEDENIKRNTLSDHCYHQPRSMERFKQKSFSETDEEEIDVVSYEKKATYFNIAQKQHEANQPALNFKQKQHNTKQLAMNFAQKQHNANQLALSFAQKQHNTNKLAADIVRRPRGRPPGSNSAKRKRTALTMSPNETPPVKRARVQAYQRGQKRQKGRRSKTYEDDEEEDTKRNLHNNMERYRRIKLKEAFELLKDQMPSIAQKDRVAKVTILQQAKVHILELDNQYERYQEEIKEKKKQQLILQKRYAELQREQRSRMLRLQGRY